MTPFCTGTARALSLSRRYFIQSQLKHPADTGTEVWRTQLLHKELNPPNVSMPLFAICINAIDPAIRLIGKPGLQFLFNERGQPHALKALDLLAKLIV